MGAPDLGPGRFMRRHQPKYVTTVNVSMWQPESVVFDILAYVFVRAGDLDGQELQAQAGPSLQNLQV